MVMTKMNKSFILLLVLMSLGVFVMAGSSWPYENETPAQRDERMGWWREARFGLFIHWGIYAVPAGTYNDKQISGIGEWIMNRGKIPVAEYKKYAKEFNPVNYDPDAWVKLAKEAGMKYIVITSKHHDGFALFDSAVTDWDIVDATPYGKDLLKPLAEACRKYGLKLGFYYSQAQDWCHPGGAASGGHWDPAQDGDMDEYIRKIAVPQVKEILTNYGDLAILWWDTPRNMTKERADMLQPLITLQPGIITNDRLGAGYKGDLITPEQHIPATGLDYDWESCMTMNDTWGYKSYDNNWKSTKTLLQNLADIASKGGNYLLNVGPKSDGTFPDESIKALKEIGQWMEVNGESIYGTTASPFARLSWGRCTKKVTDDQAVLYLHIFDWPTDGELLVPGLKTKVAEASLLANGQVLKTTRTEDGVVVTLPKEAMDPIDSVCVLNLDGKLEVQKVLPAADTNGQIELPAALAGIHNILGTDAKLVEKDGQLTVSNWTDARAWVQWSFRVDQAGPFEVIAELAIEAPETKFEIIAGSSKLRATVTSTGGYDKFKEVSLGRIEISKAGVHTLQIKPIKGQWKPMNLQSVLLAPKK